MISPVQSASNCNSFPKIFGGELYNTYMYHIDIYNDYLAFGGYTLDTSLTGIGTIIPYLAL